VPELDAAYIAAAETTASGIRLIGDSSASKARSNALTK